MSPAKRLSRKRFRALCERCRAYWLVAIGALCAMTEQMEHEIEEAKR